MPGAEPLLRHRRFTVRGRSVRVALFRSLTIEYSTQTHLRSWPRGTGHCRAKAEIAGSNPAERLRACSSGERALPSEGRGRWFESSLALPVVGRRAGRLPVHQTSAVPGATL